MTRVRCSLFVSLDGMTTVPDGTDPDNPMGDDWGPLTRGWASTRTFHEQVFGDTSGAGTTGVDDAYAWAFFTGIGAEIMGAGMFGLHSHGDEEDWRGWWGDTPPFGTPVYVLTHGAPRASIPMAGGTTFHFRSGSLADVLAEAREASAGADVRVGGGVGTARDFLLAGLVDELHLQVAPVVLDRGRRLWDGLRGLEATHAVRSEVAESGTLHVTFTRREAVA